MEDWQRKLKRLQEAINTLNQQREFERVVLLAQFQRFKLCPCIAQGRFSTCCAKLLDVKDGFFHIGDLRNANDKR
jgi:hypothetical protein